MALRKKFIIILTIILFTLTLLKAEINQFNDTNKITNIDSTFSDSLQMLVPVDTIPPIKKLKIIEKKVRELADTFYCCYKTIFKTNSYYNFSNSFYSMPYDFNEYELISSKLNNLLIDSEQLLPLLSFYSFKKLHNYRYEFLPLRIDFQPTLSAIKYANGDYNLESKYINFQKNDFFNLVNLQLFLESGEDKSPWGDKNYYDNIVFQLNKNIYDYQINYNFIKSFHSFDKINYLTTHYWGEEHFRQKNNILSNLLNISFMDNFINFSYLNQNHEEIIYADSLINNSSSRNQITLDFYFPLENYKTKILLRADLIDYNYRENEVFVHNYIGLLEMDSPGILFDFYTMHISNRFVFDDIIDSTYIYPELAFKIPIVKNLYSNISVGVHGKHIPLSISTFQYNKSRNKYILYDFNVTYRNPVFNFHLTPFYKDYKKDYQWVKDTTSDTLKFEEILDFSEYGIRGYSSIKFFIFTLKNSFDIYFYIRKKSKELVFRPDIKLKSLWDIRKELGHNNFIYTKIILNYLKNFRNLNYQKMKNEIFLNTEIGVNINRFRLSLSFNNIFDHGYFLAENNLINGFSVRFRINWNFIN